MSHLELDKRTCALFVFIVRYLSNMLYYDSLIFVASTDWNWQLYIDKPARLTIVPDLSSQIWKRRWHYLTLHCERNSGRIWYGTVWFSSFDWVDLVWYAFLGKFGEICPICWQLRQLSTSLTDISRHLKPLEVTNTVLVRSSNTIALINHLHQL